MKAILAISLMSVAMLGSVASAQVSRTMTSAGGLAVDSGAAVAIAAPTCAPTLATVGQGASGLLLQFNQAEFNRLYVDYATQERMARRAPLSAQEMQTQIQKLTSTKLGQVFPNGSTGAAKIKVTISCTFRPLNCTITIAF